MEQVCCCSDEIDLEYKSRQEMLMTVKSDAQVTGVLMTGGWPGDSAKDALSLALGGCGAVDAVMREALRSAAAGSAAVER